MSATSPGFIEPDQWKTFLDEFSQRNQLRPTRIEVVGEEIGAQPEEEYVPLVGVTLDSKQSTNIEVILAGQNANDKRRVERVITNVLRIAPILGTRAFEDGLAFEDKDGVRTFLIFELLRELPNT
jgi:Family of unknown function (DUF5335)